MLDSQFIGRRHRAPPSRSDVDE
jgi:hypothetical protein